MEDTDSVSNRSLHFSSEILNTDVTAVKFVGKFLFAGIGNNLHVFDVPNLKLCTRIEIFKHYRIHGINTDITNSFVALNGNKEVAILTMKFTNHLIMLEVTSLWNVGDWIWDVSWTNNNQIIVLTAHNAVTLWNWKTLEKIKSVICEKNCLLYCGIVLGNNWNNCIIISGTAFKQILIWTPRMCDDENSGRMLHTLSGHMGAVFCINYNEHLNRLSSTSDDRTVRIWQVSFSSNFTDMQMIEKWSSATVHLLFTIYGHVSRVWKSMVLNSGKIVSVAEDSQLRIWDENGNPVKQWETHQGASVWSLDCCKNFNLIVTGGKDGGISSWPLLNDNTDVITLQKKMSSLVLESENSVHPIPRRIVITRNEQIVSVTENGVLYALNGDTSVIILQDRRLVNYCLLEISLQRDYICLATISGIIFILKEEADGDNGFCMRVVFEDRICDGKIFSVHWLSENYLLTCASNGELVYWKTECGNSEYNAKLKYGIKNIQSFILPPCKERWLTSAFVINNEYIVAGDRDGSVHLFMLLSLHGSEPQIPCQTFHKIHGRLGVSSILYTKENELCSIGRDGYIRYWLVSNGTLEHVSADKLSVRWPVRVISTTSHGLLVLGFNEVHLELWSIKERKQILKHYCGGGHRSWDFMITDQIYFAYIREKSIFNITIPVCHLVKPSFVDGFHIKETNCACYLSDKILLSGSEDTTIRISFLNYFDGTIDTKTVIRSHISSIRSIYCLPYEDYYLIISAGGRAQLKIWKIEEKQGEYKYAELTSHMLKGDDKSRRPWRSNTPRFELEPRYMDLSAFIETEYETAVITAACSDGIWRLFTFNLKTKNLKLVQEFSYHDHCILKIFCTRWKGMIIVVTMGTDGKATFWDITSLFVNQIQLQPIFVIQLHQSGINSCDYSLLHDGSLFLASGGDDTAISVAIFDLSGSEIKLSDLCQLPVAHDSQITGIKIMGQLIVSTGVDQNIILWRWNKADSGPVTIERIGSYKSTVPDIHGLLAYTENSDSFRLCVYGAGIHIIKVSKDGDY